MLMMRCTKQHPDKYASLGHWWSLDKTCRWCGRSNNRWTAVVVPPKKENDDR